MKRILIAIATSAMLAVGCENDEIDATPGALTLAVAACRSPDSAPTPELAALARDVEAYATSAPDIVAGTIGACTSAATLLGVDLGDSSPFLGSEEWQAKGASEIRRRCSAIEAPLRAADPMTAVVALYGCEAADACVDPLLVGERCKGAFVWIAPGAPVSSASDRSSLAALLYYLPRSIRTTRTPSALGEQAYAPSPRSSLCDQTIRESATEATDRWGAALAAAAEAIESVTRASRLRTRCTASSM